MNRAWKILVGLLAVAGVVAIGCGLAFFAGGISARQVPGLAETGIARGLRHRLIPAAARKLPNPFVATQGVLEEGRAHFADHCASCHGNDGKGQTEMGRGLYPRAPDMTRRETRSLSDGELFFIIKNGVRLTGMPAWGKDTPEDDEASWKLVAFVRHIPAVTRPELEQMKALNPVSPAEAQEAKEIDEFLEGGKPPSPSGQRKPAGPHGH